MNRPARPVAFLVASCLLSGALAACSSSGSGPPVGPASPSPSSSEGQSPRPSEGQSPGASQAGFTLYQIEPSKTDDQIVKGDQHFVYVPDAGPLKDQLFVFLPGSYSKPKTFTELLSTAAGLGYRTIGLSYVNDFVVGSLCNQTKGAPPDCEQRVREENLDGTDRTPDIHVDGPDSIENRLVALVRYLDATHQKDGFGQFLEGSAIDWSKVVVAGHSQGGANAALIGKLHPVNRVIMFSSPGDWDEKDDTPAPWITMPGATPSSAYFGLVHDQEKGKEEILPNWGPSGLSLPGPPVRVDESTGDFQGSHQLLATLQPRTGGGEAFHGSTANDKYTPLLPDGAPSYKNVWAYLFGG